MIEKRESRLKILLAVVDKSCPIKPLSKDVHIAR